MTVDIYAPTDHDHLSLEELDLYHEITAYRASLGLAAVPLSKGLTTTAGRHVVDTRENIWAAGLELPADANLHSWSDAVYYADHRAPEVMWDAPERLGTGYSGSGYEISAAGQADTDAALEAWQGSAGHDAVLTNTGGWEDVSYQAIGIGVETSPGEGPYGGTVYHVWFGAETDPTGVPLNVGTNHGDEIVGTAFSDDVSGLAGADTIDGGAGHDHLKGAGGDDQVYGGSRNDHLGGGSGNDTVTGGSGNDQVYGGTGRDHVMGGAGMDSLFGGNGADIAEGGSGSDYFAFRTLAEAGLDATSDRITDFQPGLDKIHLRQIDADTGTSGNQAFRYVGDAAFSASAGELAFRSGVLTGDVDGDGAADFEVRIDGLASLGADDIVL